MHCPSCGRYCPKTLGGDQTECDCGRTRPMDGLPPNIYVCPTCLGHGAARWGCWGTQQHPHAHTYMVSIHELMGRA